MKNAEKTQQLRDFSQSFATLALSRSKTRTNSLSSAASLKEIPAFHRKSASIAQKPRQTGFHKRTLSTKTAEIEDSHEFVAEMLNISQEIKARARNYREISRFLRTYAEELQETEEKVEDYEHFLENVATFSPKPAKSAGFLCCSDAKCAIF